jgi:isocitrate/isopropylmalate dehydrogenase
MGNQKEPITFTDKGKIVVPDFPVIPFIEGDGTGPDIWRATKRVLDAAVSKAYDGNKKIEWLEILAGEKAFQLASGRNTQTDQYLSRCHQRTFDHAGGKRHSEYQCEFAAGAGSLRMCKARKIYCRHPQSHAAT